MCKDPRGDLYAPQNNCDSNQDQVESFLYIHPDYLYSPVCYTRTKLRYRDEGGLYLPRLHDPREQGRPVKGFIHHHMKDIGGAILGNSILPPDSTTQVE